jgi:hypothetical protein
MILCKSDKEKSEEYQTYLSELKDKKVKVFTWFPTRINNGKHTGKVVWLEYVWKEWYVGEKYRNLSTLELRDIYYSLIEDEDEI